MLELQNWEGLATTWNSYNSSTPKESWRIQLQQLHEIQAFHHKGADLQLGHQSSSFGIGGAISPKSSGRGFSSSSYSSDHQQLLVHGIYAKVNNTLQYTFFCESAVELLVLPLHLANPVNFLCIKWDTSQLPILPFSRVSPWWILLGCPT